MVKQRKALPVQRLAPSAKADPKFQEHLQSGLEQELLEQTLLQLPLSSNQSADGLLAAQVGAGTAMAVYVVAAYLS